MHRYAILFIGLAVLPFHLSFGQNCTVVKSDFDVFKMSDLKNFQNEENIIKASPNFVEVGYVILNNKPSFYRLSIDSIGEYSLFLTEGDQIRSKIKSGRLSEKCLQDIRSLTIHARDSFLVAKCDDVLSSEFMNLLFLKKIGYLKIVSYDGEVLRSLDADNTLDGKGAMCLRLIQNIISESNKSSRKSH